MKKLLAVIALLYSQAAFSQDIAKSEQKLAGILKELNHWVSFKENAIPDSLKEANRYFRESFLSFLSDPATLTYEYKALVKEGLRVADAEGGTFRIYSWKTGGTGGTEYFANIYQYKAANKVFAKLAPDGGPAAGFWYTEVFTKKAAGKTFYMGVSHATYSAKDSYQGIKTFCVDRNGLNDTIPLIKTETRMSNELGFTYDPGTVSSKKRDRSLIEYDEETSTFTMPDVAEDGVINKKEVQYRFAGRLVVLVKNK